MKNQNDRRKVIKLLICTSELKEIGMFRDDSSGGMTRVHTILSNFSVEESSVGYGNAHGC